LKDLQDSYVEVLVSYIVKNDDKVFALKAHDKILLEILEVFAKEGIDFAYPTQTLYTKQ
jgi:small-conductance mechanosensitive channel